MRYFLDTEFNGFGGELISLALVRDDGEYLYLHLRTVPCYHILHEMAVQPWVALNVIPILDDCPAIRTNAERRHWGREIQDFLAGDDKPSIVTDWPDDIRYFCQELIVGPGHMIQSAEQIHFIMARVDAYPTTLPGAVQHNAWWDAMALRHLVHEAEGRS